jgi:hypothetical protein
MMTLARAPLTALAVFLMVITLRYPDQVVGDRRDSRAVGSDLYAAVEQSLVDKVVNEAQYPITLIDQWWPFNPNSQLGDKAFSAAEVEQALKDAQTLDCSSKGKEKATPCQIQKAYFAGRDQFRSQIETIRSYKNKVGAKWKGPSDSELDALENEAFPIQEHLAHLKINLLKAPAIKISGVSTSVTGVSVAVDAIGETYVEYPVWICTKTCSIGPINFCCEGHFEGRWAKVLEIDVNDLKIAIDGSVNLIVDGLVVYGVPNLSNLALDYPILRDINLAPIANSALKDQRLTIIDASKLVAALPYVNTKYQIHSLAVSGTGEIRADIVVQKVP